MSLPLNLFKNFSKLFFLLFSTIILSQNNFQKGYYVDESGIKNIGYIYDLDWQNNPNSIEFKTSLENIAEKISIENIKEFELIGICKFVRYDGLLDISSNKLSDLDLNRNPTWKKEKVLLKVILDSDASLYSYSTVSFSRFFYNVKSKNIQTKQLIYKEFYLDDNKSQIGKNLEYRQQINNNLVCDYDKKTLVSRLKYNRDDLVDYFLSYNKCHGTKSDLTPSGKSGKTKINYAILSGISNFGFESKSDGSYANDNQKFDFGSKLCFRFGVEAEIMLSNNNKWSLYIQPIYQRYYSEETIQGNYSPLTWKMDYKSLNIPFGIRHYIYFNKNSKIYIDGAVGYNFNLGSELILGNDPNNVFFNPVFGANFSSGYVLNDRYSLGIRYDYSFDLINTTAFMSKFKGVGFVLKYKLN